MLAGQVLDFFPQLLFSQGLLACAALGFGRAAGGLGDFLGSEALGEAVRAGGRAGLVAFLAAGVGGVVKRGGGGAGEIAAGIAFGPW